MREGLFVGPDIYVRHLRLLPKFREVDRHAGRSLRNLCLGYGTGTGRDLSLRRLHPSLDGFEAAMSNKFGRGHAGLWDSPEQGLSLRVSSPPRPFKPSTTVVNSTLPVPLALPRLETNPPGPPCQGGKGHAPDEGFFNSPALVGIDRLSSVGNFLSP